MNGQYNDEDPLDLESFHVTVRSEGTLVACLRVTPHFHAETFIGRILGAGNIQAVLGNAGLKNDDCVEAGRWIVLPSWRGSELGRTVLLSCWVIGRWLNKRRLFGLAGTREGQAKMICRTGGQVVAGMKSRLVEHLDDELSLVYFDLDRPPPSVAMKLPMVQRLLHLESVCPSTCVPHAQNRCDGNKVGAAH